MAASLLLRCTCARADPRRSWLHLEFAALQSLSRALSHLTESNWDSHGARTVIHAVDWQRRPACMTKPLSSDLRERLIEAVAGGMSRRAAADRFGIAASTAVKWVRRWRDTGSKAPRPQVATSAPIGSRPMLRRCWGWSLRLATSRWRRLPAIWSVGTASGLHKAWFGASSIATP